MSQWIRKSHFQRKTRHLYALVFDNERAVYVGQTVNMKQRGQQHAAPSGGWLRDFRMIRLETITGTYMDAEQREFVWRWVAHLKGYQVYVLPPNVRVNLGRKMGTLRRLEAWRTWLLVGWPKA